MLVPLFLVGCDFLLPALPAVQAQLKKEYADYVQRFWTTENGLPQNTIYALTQTNDGYLWIGTDGGLARFDGISFCVFNQYNTAAFLNNSVTSLRQDRGGSLWIGTFGGGLVRYRDGQFRNFNRKDGLNSDFIWSICEDRRQNIWIGTLDKGLNRLQGGKFSAVTVRDRLPDDRITSLVEDSRDRLWIGTRNGLVSLQNGKITVYSTRNGLSSNYIYCLFEDSRKHLWVGTTAGLNRLQEDGSGNFSKVKELAAKLVRSLGEDQFGRLWIGTDDGITIFDQGTNVAFAAPDALAQNAVMAVLKDRENNLWIGTAAGGLHFLKKNEVRVYTIHDGLSSDHILSICEDRNGQLWVGSNGGGMDCFSQGKWQGYSTRNGLSSNDICAVMADSQKRIWIGTQEAGLQCLAQGKLRTFRRQDGLAGDAILALWAGQKDDMWIGCNGGLSHYAAGEFRDAILLAKLSGKAILAVNEDRAGNLWVGGFHDGLYCLRKGQWFHYAGSDLGGDTVYSICCDKTGVIWLGTNGGLSRLEREKIFSFREAAGPFSRSVLQILEDDCGNLWWSSNTGIFCALKSGLDRFAAGDIENIHYRYFGEMAGLKSTVCSGGFQPAGWKSQSGRLWFPTRKGLVMIDPRALKTDRQPPAVWLEKILVNGRVVAQEIENRFSPDSQRFDFFYTAIDFSNPQLLKFSTRLKGYEEHWSKPEAQRSRHYANLPPGRYLFRVKACGQAGVWNEKGAAFSFYLEPGFFRSGWFYVLGLIALALIFSGSYLYRLRQVQQRKNEKYKLSTLSADKARQCLQHLLQTMEKDKPYLDPDLTLTALAEILAIPAKHLSQIINEQFELNFNDFINRYRVEAAKLKLLDPAAKDAKLLRVAFEVGFNSKSVFNSAFKKNTGLSPSEFRKLLKRMN